MKEFIEELEYNQNINNEKGIENRIDINYVIERLKDIENNNTNNKTKIINVRISEKMNNKINSIKKQMIEKGFDEEELTDSFIIRHAISTLEEKMKYFIYTDK